MRPVLHADVVAAARVLLALPVDRRRLKMRQMLEQAAAADLYRKRLKRGHPLWGNGCLMSVAARSEMLPEPFLDDVQYCRCLVDVFQVLLDWRRERAALNRPCKTV
jgi:hypothetical protein